jgi:outer membrane protein assembly factor BamB
VRSPRSTGSWGCGLFLVAPLALLIALAGRAAASDFLSVAIAWSLPLTSALVAPPSANARTVYIPLRRGTIAAVSLADGGRLWEIEAPATQALALGDGQIFAATAREVLGIEASSGRVLWRFPMPEAVAAPSWRAGWLVVGDRGGELVALRATDGRVMWRQSLGGPLARPVTIDGERAYAPLRNGQIVALDIMTGTSVWRTALPGTPGLITAAGDRLYVGCTDNFFYSLDADDGSRRWRWRTGADVIGPAAVDAERVYFVSLDNVLRALDAGSGVQRWTRALDARPFSGPVLDGEALLVSGIGTALRVVRTTDGSVAGTWTAPRELAHPPVVVTGTGLEPVRAIIVTGSDVGEWRLYGLKRSIEPPPRRLTEIPGRPLSPAGLPPPPGSRPPGASPLP